MKRVLVTGASRGIGKAVASRFRSAGYEVLAPTRVALDLSSPDSIRAFAGAGLEIDVLVNNAAESKIVRLDDLALADFQRILAVNLTAALLLIQAAVGHMVRARWGRVVNISSCYSFLSRESRGAYATSKSGLNGLTRTAALEYGAQGVLVNSVCPGFVDTELTRRNNNETTVRALAAQTAVGRLAGPEEIANLVYFLGSEQNTYITGQAVVIDGGFSIQ